MAYDKKYLHKKSPGVVNNTLCVPAFVARPVYARKPQRPGATNKKKKKKTEPFFMNTLIYTHTHPGW